MVLPQFSIRELLGAVTFLAVGTAALLYASRLWASSLLSFAFALLFIAVLGAITLRDSTRAFWLGFAVFGWLYFVLINWPGESNVTRQLITNDALRYVYDDVLPRVRTTPIEQISGVRTTQAPRNRITIRRYVTIRTYDQDDPFDFGPNISYPTPYDFKRVGHSLWMLLIAYVGGRLGRYFYVRRSRDNGN